MEIIVKPTFYVHSAEDLEAVPEPGEKPETSRGSRRNQSGSQTSSSAVDQKRAASAKLLKAEVANLATKSVTQVQLSKVIHRGFIG